MSGAYAEVLASKLAGNAVLVNANSLRFRLSEADGVTEKFSAVLKEVFDPDRAVYEKKLLQTVSELISFQRQSLENEKRVAENPILAEAFKRIGDLSPDERKNARVVAKTLESISVEGHQPFRPARKNNAVSSAGVEIPTDG
jgi:hypothetical protein